MATYDENNAIKDALAFLDPTKAALISLGTDSVTGITGAIRRWGFQATGRKECVLGAMNAYGDKGNEAYEPGEKNSVAFVKIDATEKFYGEWIFAKNRIGLNEEEGEGFFQTLWLAQALTEDDFIDSLEKLDKMDTGAKRVSNLFGFEEGYSWERVFRWYALPPGAGESAEEMSRTDFLTTFVAPDAVTTWETAHAVGDIIVFAAGDTDPYYGHRKPRLVRVTKAFTGSGIITKADALNRGLVVDYWQVDSVDWGEMAEGPTVLTVVCRAPGEYNITANLSGAPTARDFVTVTRANPDGDGAGIQTVAGGIPLTASEALAAAAEADDGYLAGNISITQQGGGVASVSKSQNKIFDYLTYDGDTADGISEPREIREIKPEGNRREGRGYTWTRIDPDKIADHVTYGLLYRDEEDSGSSGITLVVSEVVRREHPDGAIDMSIILVREMTGTETEYLTEYFERFLQYENTTKAVNSVDTAIGVPWVPSGSDPFPPNPDDGYYWRECHKLIHHITTFSAYAAAHHVDRTSATTTATNPVLAGSKNGQYRKGVYYASRVVGEKYTHWFSFSRKALDGVDWAPALAGPGRLTIADT